MAKPRRKANIPADESRHARFTRVANGRLVKAYIAIELLGKLSGPGYEWTDEDITHIRRVLMDVLNRALHQFEPREETSQNANVPLLGTSAP